MSDAIQLLRPARPMLGSYVDALRRGWTPRHDKGEDFIREHLAGIDEDADAFIAQQFDPQAKGPPVQMPDGTLVPRLPGMSLWIWDGEFCGIANLRWQEGTPLLPPHVLGHIGYAVVPWKRGRGYAKAALAMMLREARARALPYVELTCDPGNLASRKVIEANGGVFVEEFLKTKHHGGTPGLRFRIDL